MSLFVPNGGARIVHFDCSYQKHRGERLLAQKPFFQFFHDLKLFTGLDGIYFFDSVSRMDEDIIPRLDTVKQTHTDPA